MKKSFWLKRVFLKIINIPVWTDWSRIKNFTLYIVQLATNLFVIRDSKGDEKSFNAAMAKLKLTEKDLIAKQKSLWRLSVLMVICAVLFLSYSTYHLFFGGTWRAALVSFIFMFFALVLAFRYHFWYFQIKERKLGCSWQEWYRRGLLGGK